MADLVLKRGEEKDITAGDLWIYDNEVEKITGSYMPGDIVDVFSYKKHFLGRGYINPKSRILVRLMTDKNEEIDRDFLERRIRASFDYRKKLGLSDSFRAVFAEADYLPALIVDKYSDCLVVQTLALGIDVRKAEIVDILSKIASPRCIYERNDVPLREKEGLKQQKGVLYGEEPGEIIIAENGLRMFVDVVNGQKTGYFLDQRENRAAIAPICKGAHMLDCFCHTGGFSLHAAKYGAASIEAVDISDTALSMVKRNAELNGFGNIRTVQANVFDMLNEYQGSGREYDVIILDPPAFCKNKAAVPGAFRGYKEINLRAMKLLKPGGFLVTCSCSHYMTQDLFLKMLHEAAVDVKRHVRISELRYQAKDHPYSVTADESLYLKCVILQVN